MDKYTSGIIIISSMMTCIYWLRHFSGLSRHARSLPTGIFQVIPLSGGDWWKEIERQGLVVKSAIRH